MVIILLSSLVNAYNRTKYVSLSNHKQKVLPALTNLDRNVYIQEFHCSPFAVKFERCFGSCNTLNGLSNKVCIPKNTRFKSRCVQHGYRDKWFEKINQGYIMRM